MSGRNPNFTVEMVHRWDELVDCRARMARLGPFLIKHLQPLRGCVVLDAAVGIGCELPYLLRRGFVVIGNELNSEFRREALNRFEAESLGIPLLASRWSQLTDHLPRGSIGAILLLGNSLPLLSSKQERKQACTVFHELLVGGGVLIVDHRNFDYIIAKRAEVLNGQITLSDNTMYCGSKLKAVPTEISEEVVRIACVDPHDGRQIGYCDTYPFRGNELDRLLAEVGFGSIQAFYDYSEQATEAWNFRIVVARR